MIGMRNIKQAANRIAQRFRPQQIILFGSYAYGTPDSSSDVDLLILVDDHSRLRNASSQMRVHDQALHIREAINFDFPVDLLVRSREEFQQRVEWGDYFLREVQQKGRVLYEAPDARMGQKSRRRFRHRAA